MQLFYKYFPATLKGFTLVVKVTGNLATALPLWKPVFSNADKLSIMMEPLRGLDQAGYHKI